MIVYTRARARAFINTNDLLRFDTREQGAENSVLRAKLRAVSNLEFAAAELM